VIVRGPVACEARRLRSRGEGAAGNERRHYRHGQRLERCLLVSKSCCRRDCVFRVHVKPHTHTHTHIGTGTGTGTGTDKDTDADTYSDSDTYPKP
jgi:hypothetical protein